MSPPRFLRQAVVELLRRWWSESPWRPLSIGKIGRQTTPIGACSPAAGEVPPLSSDTAGCTSQCDLDCIRVLGAREARQRQAEFLVSLARAHQCQRPAQECAGPRLCLRSRRRARSATAASRVPRQAWRELINVGGQRKSAQVLDCVFGAAGVRAARRRQAEFLVSPARAHHVEASARVRGQLTVSSELPACAQRDGGKQSPSSVWRGLIRSRPAQEYAGPRLCLRSRRRARSATAASRVSRRTARAHQGRDSGERFVRAHLRFRIVVALLLQPLQLRLY